MELILILICILAGAGILALGIFLARTRSRKAHQKQSAAKKTEAKPKHPAVKTETRQKEAPKKTPAKKKPVSEKKQPAKKAVPKQSAEDTAVYAPGYEEYEVLWKTEQTQTEHPEFEERKRVPKISDFSNLTEEQAKDYYLELTAYTKGAELEDEVFSYLNGNSVKGYHKALKNLYVPVSDGMFTEIDCILVHVSGIYVIECKNYDGLVSGTTVQKQWNVSYNSGRTTVMYNPVRQNKGHILALAAYLNMTEDAFHSCVVFGDDTVLSVSKTLGKSVISFSAVKTTFTHEVETAERVYSSSQVDKIVKSLVPCTEVPYLARLQHIARISEKQKETTGETYADFDSYFV